MNWPADSGIFKLVYWYTDYAESSQSYDMEVKQKPSNGTHIVKFYYKHIKPEDLLVYTNLLK